MDAVLDALQDFFKDQRNEALHRRELLYCRQAEGENFGSFYVRLKSCAEEVDLCPGHSVTCAGTQLKMVILMGVRDEELIQRLISLDASALLQDIVNHCRSYESTHTTASAIHAFPSQMYVVSSYKHQKRWKRTQTTSASGLKGNCIATIFRPTNNIMNT